MVIMKFLTIAQNWIGSEAVKRKRKAGILPRPKIEIAGVRHTRHTILHIHSIYFVCVCVFLQSEMNPKIITGPPVKKIKRVNGYNLFFSDCVRSNPEISTGME